MLKVSNYSTLNGKWFVISLDQKEREKSYSENKYIESAYLTTYIICPKKFKPNILI